MNKQQRIQLLTQIVWDYDIPVWEVEAVLSGKKLKAGHYTRETIFLKLIETYSWFTLLGLFSAGEIKNMLTPELIAKVRSTDLQKKYEFARKRLQQLV